MSERLVIGLCGAANSGKNTVAALLGFREVSFADPLYRMLSEMLDVSVDSLRDRRAKERIIPWLGKSPRQLLQTLGTEWGRSMVADDIWVRLAMREINKNEANVAVTDVRFDNEAEMLKREFGGVIWKVERPGASTCAGHTSEAGISPHLVDRVVVNGGAVGDLEATVREALNATLKDTSEGQTSDRRTCCAP